MIQREVMKNNFHRRNSIFNKLISLFICSSMLQTTACNPNQAHTTINQLGQAVGPSNLGGGTGGTGDGGGGQGIRCDSTTKEDTLKNKTFVRDIFEVITNNPKQIPLKLIPEPADGNEVSDEALDILVQSLKAYFGPASENLEFTKIQTWRDLLATRNMTERDLVISKDANSAITPPSGCEIVQIAYWTELKGANNKGTLTINIPLWKSLNQLNKVALLAHEYFYAQARTAGYTNSDFIRYQIGHLFLATGLAPLFKEWEPSQDPRTKYFLPAHKNGYKYCEGKAVEDINSTIQYYQYEGKDKKQHFVIPYINSKIINYSLLQDTHFSFMTNLKDGKLTNEPSLVAATDLMLYNSYNDNQIAHNALLENSFWIANDNLRGVFVDLWHKKNGFLSQNYNLIDEKSLKDYSRKDISALEEAKTISSINFDFYKITLNYLSTYNSILWTSYLPAVNQPIEISILNPITERQRKKIILSRTKKDVRTLINEVNSSIRRELSWLPGKNDISSEIIDEGIDAINADIRDELSSGPYSIKFQRWNVFLLKFISLKNDNLSPQQNDKEILSSKMSRLSRLKSLLLKLEQNSYTDADFDKMVSQYESDNEEKVNSSSTFEPEGNLLLKQGNYSLHFKLQCKSYDEKFSSLTQNTDNNFNLTTFKMKANVSINAKSFESVIELNNASKLLDIFSTHELVPFEGITFGKACNDRISINGSSCQDSKMLLNKLMTAQSLNVSSCDRYLGFPSQSQFKVQISESKEHHNQLNENYSMPSDNTMGTSSCLILHFEPNNNDLYLTYFGLGLSNEIRTVTEQILSTEKFTSPRIRLQYIKRMPRYEGF